MISMRLLLGQGCFKRAIFTVLLVSSGMLAGCAQQFSQQGQEKSTIFAAEQGEALARRHAPAFFVYEAESSDNRIGMVRAGDGGAKVYIDPDQPVIYVGEFPFTTEKGSYTNLIYRVHFARVPLSHITAGKNGGLLVVLTLNAAKEPVLVSTLGTCGCYLTITPTNFLPDSALPQGFNRETPLKVYGEVLPGSLDYSGAENPRLLVFVRPEVHRVMDLALVNADSLPADPEVSLKRTELTPMEDLERLAVPDSTATTSFFHESGLLKGYVKDAMKPWELLLLSGVAMDLFVGVDKAYYGDAKKGLPLYTSLKPWARADSDLRDFPRFLSYWGWRL